jgi:plasmid segregation protein ParM
VRLSKAACADIGHSAIKVIGRDGEKTFRWTAPSVAVRAHELDDETAIGTARRDTYAVGEQQWWVGDTATIQGGALANTGLTAEWVSSNEHDALIVAAFSRLKDAGYTAKDTVFMMGLPPKFLRTQRDLLKARVKGLTGIDVKVQSQGMGPYFHVMMDSQGNPATVRRSGHKDTRRDISKESWGVIEVGHFTTDFAIIENGVPVQEGVTSVKGVRNAVQQLTSSLNQKYKTDELEVAKALVTRTIRQYGQDLDVGEQVDAAVKTLAAEISEQAGTVLGGRAHKLNGIVVAGGGAGMIAPVLRENHGWPHVVILDEPRFAVAEGLTRFGMAVRSMPV